VGRRSKGGDFVPLPDHLEAIRALEYKLGEERDRRYAEVNIEKEKALKIKETADLAALQLAREIQTYKDEKANELRSQIERERGDYPTRSELASAVEKFEAQLKPLLAYVTTQQGRSSGLNAGWALLVGASTVIIAAGGLAIALNN
jgi:hypothetical protein